MAAHTKLGAALHTRYRVPGFSVQDMGFALSSRADGLWSATPRA